MSMQILYMGESPEAAQRFRDAATDLGAELVPVQMTGVERRLALGARYGLVAVDVATLLKLYQGDAEALAAECRCPILLVAGNEDIVLVDPPTSMPYDFVMSQAGGIEYAMRVRHLLSDVVSPGESAIMMIDDLTVNLESFQATVGGMPIDLTYREYGLLSYLMQHPGHTFTRDALLKSVWGHDHDGGARTVDVHVCRLRTKLGPVLAGCLETVRGVGYRWSPSPTLEAKAAQV